jgi:lysophospholipase L1-like esterase
MDTRWWRSIVGAVLGAVLVVALAAMPAAAAPARHGTHPNVDYLALGDSVAFGYTPPAVTPQEDYQDASNFTGYPGYLAASLGVPVANASCAGETTASLIDAAAPSNGCENSPGSPVGYRDAYPLHVAYSGSQLDYAVGYLRSHPHTRLVTIDIGANDLFLCQETTADHCTGSDFAAALNQVSRNLSHIYRTLRTQAHYHHAIVLLSYYALDYRDPQGVASIQALNAALIGPTLRYGGRIADGFTAFARASAQAGGNPCAAGLLVKLPDGTCNIHPSPHGHRVLARAIKQVLPRSLLAPGRHQHA